MNHARRPGIEVDGVHAARRSPERVADADIGVAAVRCRAPLRAERAACADAVLPDDGAGGVRIERIDDTRLLRHDEQLAPARRRRQQRRRTEVEIGTLLLGTVGIGAALGAHCQSQMSFGTVCRTQRRAPVRRSSARIAFIVGCGGSAKPLPVPTYRTPRAASIVGAPQMPAPAGPKSCTPFVLVPRGAGAISMRAFAKRARRSADRAPTRCRETCNRHSLDSGHAPLRRRRTARRRASIVHGGAARDGGVRMLVELACPDETARFGVERVRLRAPVADEHAHAESRRKAR